MKSYRLRFSKHEHEPDNKHVTRNDLLGHEKFTNVSYNLLRYEHDIPGLTSSSLFYNSAPSKHISKTKTLDLSSSPQRHLHLLQLADTSTVAYLPPTTPFRRLSSSGNPPSSLHYLCRHQTPSFLCLCQIQILGKYQEKVTVPFVPGSDYSSVVEFVCPKVTKFRVRDRVCSFATVGSFAQFIVAEDKDLGNEKVQLLKAMGVDHVVDLSKDNVIESAKAFLKTRKLKGVDVLYDPVGGKITKESMKLLNWQHTFWL
ncbi:putative NADPH:quinone reductase [Helianthus debilis subsp. tardiflorus]